MDGDWVKIYTTSQLWKAEMIKSILEEHDLNVIIMNKKDSAYGFGDIELYALREQVVQALHIIKKQEL